MSDKRYLNDDCYIKDFNQETHNQTLTKCSLTMKDMPQLMDTVEEPVNIYSSDIIIGKKNTTRNQNDKEFLQNLEFNCMYDCENHPFPSLFPELDAYSKEKNDMKEYKDYLEDSIIGKYPDVNKTSLNTQEISVGLEEKKTNNLISIHQNNSSKLLELKKENNNSKLKEKLSQQKDDSFLIKSDKDYSNKSINLNTSWHSCICYKDNIYNFFQSEPQVPYNKELLFQHDLQNTSLGLNKKSSGLSKENLEVSRDLHKPLENPKSNNNEPNKLLGNKRNKPNKEPKKIFTIKNLGNIKACQNNKKEKKEQLNDLDIFDNISEINRNDSEDHLNDPEIIPIVQELGTNKKGNENKINIDNNFNVDIPLRENNAITSIKYYVVKKFIDEINEKIAVKDKTKQLCVTKFAKSINRNKNLESYRQKWKDILLIIYKDEEINENNLENNRETIKHIYDNKENFEDAYNLLEMPFDKYYNNFLNNNLEEFISKQREKQFADFKQKKYKMIIEKLIQDKNWDELNIIKVKFISFISLNKEGEKKIKTKHLSEEDFFHCYSYTIYKPEEFQNYVKKIDKSLNFDFEYEKEIIERNMCLLKNTAKRYENWFSEKTPRKIKKKFFKVKSSFKNS